MAKDDSRRYDEAAAERAKAAIRTFQGKRTQQALAEILGVDQGTVSRSLSANGQPTLRLLIAFRAKANKSIDEVLGLPMLPGRSVDTGEVAKAIAAEVMARMDERKGSPQEAMEKETRPKLDSSRPTRSSTKKPMAQ